MSSEEPTSSTADVKISERYSGRTFSESVHVLINNRGEEDNTKCSHEAYCDVWGNIWVAIATPALILSFIGFVIYCIVDKKLQ